MTVRLNIFGHSITIPKDKAIPKRTAHHPNFLFSEKMGFKIFLHSFLISCYSLTCIFWWKVHDLGKLNIHFITQQLVDRAKQHERDPKISKLNTYIYGRF